MLSFQQMAALSFFLLDSPLQALLSTCPSWPCNTLMMQRQKMVSHRGIGAASWRQACSSRLCIRTCPVFCSSSYLAQVGSCELLLVSQQRLQDVSAVLLWHWRGPAATGSAAGCKSQLTRRWRIGCLVHEKKHGRL